MGKLILAGLIGFGLCLVLIVVLKVYYAIDYLGWLALPVAVLIGAFGWWLWKVGRGSKQGESDAE